MTQPARQDHVFQILRWPLNILLFQLALSFGLSKWLEMQFGSAIPSGSEALCSTALALLSLLVLNRYFPSDKHFSHLPRTWPIFAWNAAFFLIFYFPFLAVYSSKSALFWLFAICAGGLKGLYELEDARRAGKLGATAPNCAGIESIESESQSCTPCDQPISIKLPPWIEGMYSETPRQFALKQRPTKILFTITGASVVLVATGVAMMLSGIRSPACSILSIVGLYIGSSSASAFILLSSLSRRRALQKASMLPDEERQIAFEMIVPDR